MPAWTYAALKAIDAALPGSPLPLATAATTVNAQTTTMPASDIAWATIRDIILNAGEWGTLEQVASAAVASVLPTGGGMQSAAIQADAILLRAGCLHGGILAASATATWTKFAASLARLVTAAAISQGTATAITALRTPTVPVWSPSVSAADIQTARSQP